MHRAAVSGHLHIVKWLHKRGYQCEPYTWADVVKDGLTQIVKWLYKHTEVNVEVAWWHTHVHNHRYIERWLRRKNGLKR